MCLKLASFGCYVLYLMYTFDSQGFAMTLTMFVLHEGTTRTGTLL